MILVAGSLILVCSVLLTALLKPPDKPAYALSIYLLSYANIVLAGYIANTVWLLNQPAAFMVIQAGFAAVAAWVWQRAGKPSFVGPFENWRTEIASLRRASLRPHLALLVLLGGMAAAYVLDLVLIVTVPQNNMDSLSTHLSRAGYWLQYGSFFPWPTAHIFQLFYPVNAQLQIFWTVLFLRSDVLAGSIQWTAALTAAIGAFGLARILGFSRERSAFAALILLGFPLVLLQSTTAQNDLVTAALFVPAVYFLVLGMDGNHRSMLALSALSLGLGLGTKQTYYFLLPGLCLLAAGAVLKLGRAAMRNAIYWGIGSVLGVAVFAAYMNVVNVQYFGHPFGPAEYFDSEMGNARLDSVVGEIRYNAPRLLYQAIDPGGLPRPLDGHAHKAKLLIVGNFLKLIDLNIEGDRYAAPGHPFRLAEQNANEESLAWFGPLSVLLLFPAMCYGLYQGIRLRDYLRIGLVGNAAIFLLLDVILRPGWDPYQGRYFAPAVAAAAPLMAALPWGRVRRIFDWGAVILALVVTFTTVLYNPAKPLAGKYADYVGVWTHDRIYLETVQRKKDRAVNYLVAQNVPEDAVLGLYQPGYVLDYPFFGEHFTRRIIQVYPYDRIDDVAWLQANRIEYLLVQGNDQVYARVPALYVQIAKVPKWKLFRLQSGP